MANKEITLPRGRVPVDPDKRDIYLKRVAKENGTTVAKVVEFIANRGNYEPKHDFSNASKKSEEKAATSVARARSKAQTAVAANTPSAPRSSVHFFLEIRDAEMNGAPSMVPISRIVGVTPNGNDGQAVVSFQYGEGVNEITVNESYESIKARISQMANVIDAPEMVITTEGQLHDAAIAAAQGDEGITVEMEIKEGEGIVVGG